MHGHQSGSAIAPSRKPRPSIRHHGDYIMGYMLNAGFAEDVKAWHEKHPHTQSSLFSGIEPDAPEELKVDDTLTFHRHQRRKIPQDDGWLQGFATTARI